MLGKFLINAKKIVFVDDGDQCGVIEHGLLGRARHKLSSFSSTTIMQPSQDDLIHLHLIVVSGVNVICCTLFGQAKQIVLTDLVLSTRFHWGHLLVDVVTIGDSRRRDDSV